MVLVEQTHSEKNSSVISAAGKSALSAEFDIDVELDSACVFICLVVFSYTQIHTY